MVFQALYIKKTPCLIVKIFCSKVRNKDFEIHALFETICYIFDGK